MSENEEFLEKHLLENLPEHFHSLSKDLVMVVRLDQELISRSHLAARNHRQELQLLLKRFSPFIEDEENRLGAAKVVLEYVEVAGAKILREIKEVRERCFALEKARKTSHIV